MITNPESVLVYDGSFDGFLTCVFEVYELKLNQVSIRRKENVQESLFGSIREVSTDPAKADRVWKGISKKTSASGKTRIYHAFLSEDEAIENLLLRYIQYVFKSGVQVDLDFSNPDVLKVTQIAKSVGREKHRMEAFVRFRLSKEGFYFAAIAPDFNVVPLISGHFERRYADQKWIIYDLKRNYGIYYDLEKVAIIEFSFAGNFNALQTSSAYFAAEELEFQTLWKDYFKSTNIPSRKNMRLHIQHVPKRYWKYLSEKTG